MKKLPIVIFVILIFLALVIFFSNTFPPFKFLSSSAQSIFSTPKGLIYGMSHSQGSDSEQIAKLKKENQQLSKKLLNYERVIRDNEALRSQFETSLPAEFSLAPAKIIGFSGALFSPIALVVDAGKNENIKPDMGVVVGNNLIGKVGKVSDNYSEVILSINPKFKTLAKTSDSGIAGVVAGGDDFILFDRVSSKEDISKSKTLVSQGTINSSGVGVPPDLVVGKIVSINKSPSLPFQTAKVEPLIDFGKLEEVFIVKNY